MPTVRDAGPERRPKYRKPRAASFPVAWILVFMVAIGAGGFGLLHLSKNPNGLSDVRAIESRTDNILSSWRDLKPSLSYDKTGTNLFSPIAWDIGSAEVFEKRGRCVVTVESSNKGGVPIRVVWEMQFHRMPEGWVAVKMVNAQDGYISGSWKF